MLRKDLTLDACQDLSYLSQVIQEALRLNPPVQRTDRYHFENQNEVQVGGLKVRAGDSMVMNINGLHRNSK